jgi:FAD/FMN-containing dehydrogenase
MAQAAFAERCGEVTAHLAELLERHGGSISAEHGIGLAKKPYLLGTRSAAEIELMRGIRRVFDPNEVMNPGKLFDS